MSYRRMGRAWNFVLLACVACPAAACGAADPGAGTDPTATEQPSSTIAQPFTESTCGATPPDIVENGPDAISTARDGSYDHSQCTHAYVVQANTSTTGFLAYAQYAATIVPPSGPISGCDGMWVKMSLWRYNGITFVKVADAPYTVGAPTPDGTACLAPSTQIAIPSTGKYKIIAQAGFATTYQAVNAGIYRGDLHDMSSGSSRGYTADGDWAPGLLVGECNFAGMGTYITGVSVRSNSSRITKNLFCSATLDAYPSDTTLNIASGSDRRSTTSGDWDPGYVKAECPQGEVLTAIAQTSGGNLKRARCAPKAITTDSCETVTVIDGDDRESLWGGDWSPGDFKGQCPEPLVAAGFSKDTVPAGGKLRKLLCCRPHGHPS